MSGFPIGTTCAGLVVLASLVMGMAEVLATFLGRSVRPPVYAGSLAGITIGIGGWLCAVKLASIKNKPEAVFWKWWGIGMLTRLVLMFVFSMVLAWQFKEQMTVALLTMAVIYLISMFAEAAWLVKFFVTDNH